MKRFRGCDEQLCSSAGAEALFPAAAFMVRCSGFCPYPQIAVPLSLTSIYEVPFWLSPLLWGVKRVDFFSLCWEGGTALSRSPTALTRSWGCMDATSKHTLCRLGLYWTMPQLPKVWSHCKEENLRGPVTIIGVCKPRWRRGNEVRLVSTNLFSVVLQWKHNMAAKKTKQKNPSDPSGVT